MITLPEHFDGISFMEKFELSYDDFYASQGKLYINSEIEITQEDVDSCVVDLVALVEERERPASAVAKLRVTPFPTLEFSEAGDYIDNEVTDLASVKKVLKFIFLILIAFRDIMIRDRLQ